MFHQNPHKFILHFYEYNFFDIDLVVDSSNFNRTSI